MKQQPDLFRLIHSLSKSEKRYFKIYASRHVIGEENNYIRLFNAIDRQQEYDEAALRAQFKDEKFAGHLAVTRNYLYRLILESMRVYHAEHNPTARIRNHLQDAEFFYDRLFYAQSRKSLERARRLIEEYDRYTYMPAVLELERRLMVEEEYEGASPESLTAFADACREAVAKIENISSYWDISARLFFVYLRQGATRTEELLQEVRALIDTPLLRDENAALTFEAREYFYHINGTYYFLLGDYAQAHYYSGKHIALLEQTPGYIERQASRYLGRVSIYLSDSFKLKKYGEFFAGIEKIRTFFDRYPSTRDDKTEAQLFKLLAMLELFAHVELGNYDKGLALAPAIEQGLQQYAEHIEQSLVTSFYFNFASLYFLAQRYNEALHWINELLNTSLPVREDVYSFARVFSMIIHLSLPVSWKKNVSLRVDSSAPHPQARVYSLGEGITARFSGIAGGATAARRRPVRATGFRVYGRCFVAGQ
jgi:RNase P protein component